MTIRTINIDAVAAVMPPEGDASSLANVFGFAWNPDAGALSFLATLIARIRWPDGTYDLLTVRPGVFYRTGRKMESVQIWCAGIAAGTSLALDIATEPDDLVGSRPPSPRWCEVFRKVGAADETLVYTAPAHLATGAVGLAASSGPFVWFIAQSPDGGTTANLYSDALLPDGTLAQNGAPVAIAAPFKSGASAALSPGGRLRLVPQAGHACGLRVFLLG